MGFTKPIEQIFIKLSQVLLMHLKDIIRRGVNMCTALEKLEEKCREDGRQEMKQETVLSLANLGMPVDQIAAVVKESALMVQKCISEGKAAV